MSSFYDKYVNPFVQKAETELKRAGDNVSGSIDKYLNGDPNTTRDENSGQRVIPSTEQKVLPATEPVAMSNLIPKNINWQAVSGIVAVITLVFLVLRRK